MAPNEKNVLEQDSTNNEITSLRRQLILSNAFALSLQKEDENLK